MTRSEFENQPEFVPAKTVRDFLGVGKRELLKIKSARPEIARVLPGLANPKYVKAAVLRLVKEPDTAPIASGNLRRGQRKPRQ